MKTMLTWNLWHGCHKISAGCKHCYVYRQDEKFGRDSSIVNKTANFNLPIKRKRNSEYKIPAGTVVNTCFTSDFFVEDADIWRDEAWKMIKERNDLNFLIITKRIDRFLSQIPSDWYNGYDNVAICCTVENQEMADYRLPIYLSVPIKHKSIICEPLLERIDISSYINNDIELVVAGGESGPNARVCDYSWVLDLRKQCLDLNTSFYFKQTGAYFLKDKKFYKINRKYQHSQARKANLNFKTDNCTFNF